MGQISGRLSWEVLTWEFLRGCIQVSAGAASSGGLIVAVGSASMMLTWQLGGGLGSSPCRPPCLGPLCNMAARFSQGVGSQRASQNPQCLLSPSLGSHMHFILMVIWSGPNSVLEGTLHSMGTRIRGSHNGYRSPHLPFDISSYPACEILFLFY